MSLYIKLLFCHRSQLLLFLRYPKSRMQQSFLFGSTRCNGMKTSSSQLSVVRDHLLLVKILIHLVVLALF